jgi:hypothetical protein
MRGWPGGGRQLGLALAACAFVPATAACSHGVSHADACKRVAAVLGELTDSAELLNDKASAPEVATSLAGQSAELDRIARTSPDDVARVARQLSDAIRILREEVLAGGSHPRADKAVPAAESRYLAVCT